jgi:16S rRNA (guanine527-N7)-methyltransferase
MPGIHQYSQWFGRSAVDVQHDLESFAALLLKWNAVQNLVSRETEKSVWERHILDSLQLLPLIGHQAEPPLPADEATLNVLDVGSGGGLPAIPLAIALKGTGARFTLVEPISKKVSFLRTAIRELGLTAKVHAGRIEEIDSRETFPGVITSRALADLGTLFRLFHPFFGPETVAILHKGKDHAVEVAESRLAWDFDVVLTNSATDDRGVLLRITNLRPKTGV